MLYIFYTEKKRLRDKWYTQGTNLDLGPEEAVAQMERETGAQLLWTLVSTLLHVTSLDKTGKPLKEPNCLIFQFRKL